MADSKITALASISTSTDPAVDPLVIVDVSDTSMAASGTSKKVTLNNLLSSSPTATGAFSVTGLVTAGSATITGDLTVATDAFKVISSTKDVCIGTVTPTFNNKLTVVGGGGGDAFITSGNGTRTGYIGTDGTTVIMGGYSNHTLRIHANDLPQMQIAPLGIFDWYDGAASPGTRMTLNSTGLGIGVSPVAYSDKSLTLYGSTTSELHLLTGNTGSLSSDGVSIGITSANELLIFNREAAAIRFGTNNTDVMRIDSSGNVVSNVTATPPTLATNSQMVFNLTSNTNLRISVRGTDGTTRVANITLA